MAIRRYRTGCAVLVRLLVFVLRLYRWTISPLLGPVCRFHPSCSRYAEGCLLTHGPFYGSILTIKRLAKCHPFHPGGYDPVPPGRGGQSLSGSEAREARGEQLAVATHAGKGHP